MAYDPFGVVNFASNLMFDTPENPPAQPMRQTGPRVLGEGQVQGRPPEAYQQAKPPSADEQLKAVALPKIEAAIKDGTVTKDKYILKAVEAENQSRQLQGQPPMEPEEHEQEVKRQTTLWTQMSLKGKAGMLFAVSLAGALAGRGLMAQDQARVNDRTSQSIDTMMNGQKELDAQYQSELAAQQARKQRASERAQDRGDKAAEGAANRGNQYDIAKLYADSNRYEADQRAAAAEKKLQDNVDKQNGMTPQQLTETVDASLVGAGFNQFADKKGKTLDPNFANAKGQLMSMFNAYRNAPQYKNASDGQILQAILKKYVTAGTPDTNRIPFMDNSTPPQFNQ